MPTPTSRRPSQPERSSWRCEGVEVTSHQWVVSAHFQIFIQSCRPKKSYLYIIYLSFSVCKILRKGNDLKPFHWCYHIYPVLKIYELCSYFFKVCIILCLHGGMKYFYYIFIPLFDHLVKNMKLLFSETMWFQKWQRDIDRYRSRIPTVQLKMCTWMYSTTQKCRNPRCLFVNLRKRALDFQKHRRKV